GTRRRIAGRMTARSCRSPGGRPSGTEAAGWLRAFASRLVFFGPAHDPQPVEERQNAAEQVSHLQRVYASCPVVGLDAEPLSPVDKLGLRTVQPDRPAVRH